MVNLRRCTLFVVTFLQLCRAEILDALPEWYSANVINDGFQPKSISEIFSTESSFSSTNPIVVLGKSSAVPDEILLLSTLGPPTRQVSVSTTTPSGFTEVSLTPLSPSTIPPTQPTLPPSPIISPTSPLLLTSSIRNLPPSPTQNEQPSPIQTQVQQTTVPVTQSTLFEQQQVRVEVVPLANNQSIPIQLGQFPSQIGQPGVTQQAPREPLSNYFMIYQQAPQNIQGFPSRPPDIIIASNPSAPVTAAPIPITNPVPTVQTIPAAFIQPSSITSASRSLPPSIQTLPTFRPNNTQALNTNCPPQRLLATTPGPAFGGVYPLSIRVVAPLGSITNVKIYPTTTKRPTTTRTKRTKKPRRNTYERCVDSCRRDRDPICAVPLASTPIDVNTLKGFPSVCHMACHNSYRKDPYEKLSDGRCGRLRTRIQAVGSKSKLTRDELNKAQYSVVGSEPQTIVEFSGLL